MAGNAHKKSHNGVNVANRPNPNAMDRVVAPRHNPAAQKMHPPAADHHTRPLHGYKKISDSVKAKGSMGKTASFGANKSSESVGGSPYRKSSGRKSGKAKVGKRSQGWSRSPSGGKHFSFSGSN